MPPPPRPPTPPPPPPSGTGTLTGGTGRRRKRRKRRKRAFQFGSCPPWKAGRRTPTSSSFTTSSSWRKQVSIKLHIGLTSYFLLQEVTATLFIFIAGINLAFIHPLSILYMCIISLPYTAKLSRGKTFAVLHPTANVLRRIVNWP